MIKKKEFMKDNNIENHMDQDQFWGKNIFRKNISLL